MTPPPARSGAAGSRWPAWPARLPRPAPAWAGPLLGNAGLLLLGLLWHLASQTGLAGLLPGPVQVAASLWSLLQEKAFLADLLASGVRVALSLCAAMAIGGLLAILPHWVPWLSSIVHDAVKPFLNSFPAIAWVLLASIWLGVSNLTVVLVETAILVPFCLVNISEGVRLLDRELLEMGRSFTGHGRRVFLSITLPLLLPYIVSALRSAYGVAWKIALVAELFGARSGLGFAMLHAETFSDTTGVLAICLAIVIVGIAGDRWLIEPLNRRTQGIASIT
jgi:NitT/TauT family transport system permease protein/sulfonate transport system permease protein